MSAADLRVCASHNVTVHTARAGFATIDGLHQSVRALVVEEETTGFGNRDDAMQAAG
jgi:hypothetical protein